MKSIEDKFLTVIQNNTYFFYDYEFEEKYEAYINSIKQTLLIVKQKVETEGLKKEIFEWLLKEKENGLRALLSLTGFSDENLKRLTTIIRIENDDELNRLVLKDKWIEKTNTVYVKEWSNNTIEKFIKTDTHFRKGIVNLFFEGSTIPFLAKLLPLFELKKLGISKLKFDVSELLDSIIRYKEKGSYSGTANNNPEFVIKQILRKLDITYETGDLPELKKHVPNNKRTMDFIIPNKEKPQLVIESSFLSTTSSGQGDKAKTEISISELIGKYYPDTKFIGFVDGIGWYVREKDLQRIVTAFEDVFTFHDNELQRFEKLLIETFKK